MSPDRHSAAPLVSVVVPVYNVRGYLTDTLLSVQASEFTEYEVVLVDDGSNDGSDSIIKKFARTDPRFRWVRQRNQGPSVARNRGVAEAKGRYLFFLDSDDLLTPDGLGALVAALERSGSDVAVSPYQRFSSDGVVTYPEWIEAAHRTPLQGVTAAQHPAILAHTVNCSKLYRRSYWDQYVGAFEVGMLYEDHEVAGRVYPTATLDVVSTVSVLWRIREEGTSITQRAGAENVGQFLDAALTQLRLYERMAPELVAPRLQQLLDRDLPSRVWPAVGVEGNALLRPVLTGRLRPFAERITAEIAAPVSVLDRLAVLLAASDRWDLIDAVRTSIAVQTNLPRDMGFSERSLIAFGSLRNLAAAVPAWALEPPVAIPGDVVALQPA